jgi:hypothetical protein
MSGRAAATALGKVTWVLAIAFICTSITLTILAAQRSAGTSVIDRLGVTGAGRDRRCRHAAGAAGRGQPAAPRAGRHRAAGAAGGLTATRPRLGAKHVMRAAHGALNQVKVPMSTGRATTSCRSASGRNIILRLSCAGSPNPL